LPQERKKAMSNTRKIVLIDDDQDLCDLLKLQIEASGDFQVVTSTSSETALTMIKEEQPALAILDINMPRLHGVELAAILAQDEQTAGIPILYLSGMVSPDEVSRLGGGHTLATLLSKQSPIAELLAAIDGLLQP
jgi:CheY-like chemotaxis protein